MATPDFIDLLGAFRHPYPWHRRTDAPPLWHQAAMEILQHMALVLDDPHDDDLADFRHLHELLGYVIRNEDVGDNWDGFAILLAQYGTGPEDAFPHTAHWLNTIGRGGRE